MCTHWLHVSAASIGMLVAAPFTLAQRVYPPGPPPPAYQGQGEQMQHRQVNMNDLPRAAQQGLAALAQGRGITRVWQFQRGNFIYYKAELADGSSIHVDPMGQSLDQAQVMSNVLPPGSPEWGNQWYNYATAESNGAIERVHRDQVPRQVREAIDSLRRNAPVNEVDRVNYRDQTYYRVDLGGDQSRTLRIAPDGNLLFQEDANAPGHRRIDFANLPPQVKNTLSNEAAGQRIDRIFEVNRDGRTLYFARIEDRDHVRMVLINSRGEIVRERSRENEHDHQRDHEQY